MTAIDYVQIPPAATRLQSHDAGDASESRTAMKVVTALPQPGDVPPSRSMSLGASQVQSPTRSGFNFQQALLSSTFQIPSNAPAAPRAMKGAPKLLSTRDPLSIPITTANFRRFVAKVGPVFWLQDRMEEIIMWRKGWKYTTVWMCAYAFLCELPNSMVSVVLIHLLGFYPRLCLLMPIVVLLGALLGTHPTLRGGEGSSPPPRVPPPPPGQVPDWSLDWLANVQAIQNLMGAL